MKILFIELCRTKKREEEIMNIETIQNELLEALRPLHLDRIILFGSYAYGTPHKDSDIDLYIVTNDDYIPQSYKEKQALVWKVSQKSIIVLFQSILGWNTHEKNNT